jgi:hypothetical protein
MEISGVGSGVMIAIAAALWLVYLVPSWLRRREYVTTERNAIRLQQTMRILAETAEVPDAVRAEASARSVAEKERVLRELERRRERAAAATRRSLDRPRRLRRARALTSLVLFASVAVGVTAFVSAFVAFSAVAWVLTAVSLVSSIGCVSLLGRLAAAGRATAPVTTPQARRVVLPPVEVAEAAPVVAREWTPVPVPKPLYLSREKLVAVANAEAANELVAASAASERVVRATQESVPDIRRSAPASVPAVASNSRFASMGRLDDDALGRPDIDAALARRRLAG